jgi:serine/threonine protein kinase
VGALVGTHSIVNHLVGEARQRLEQQATTRVQDGVNLAANTLLLQAQSLELRAQTIASIDYLRSLVNSPGVLDKSTVEDGFFRDAWSEPLRKEFPLFGLLTGKSTDFVHGLDIQKMPVDQLVSDTRDRDTASWLIQVGDQAVELGASVVNVPVFGGGPKAVVILGRPVDSSLLGVLARSHPELNAMLLSDGEHAMTQSGPEDNLLALLTAQGHEGDGHITDPNGAWSAAAKAVSPHLWLWAMVDTHDLTEKATAQIQTSTSLCWGAAALVVVVSLLLGFRRAQPAGREIKDNPNGNVPFGLKETLPSPPAKNRTLSALAPDGDPNSLDTSMNTDSTYSSIPKLPAVQSGNSVNHTTPMANLSSGDDTFRSSAKPLALDNPLPQGLLGSKPVFGRYVLVEKLGSGGMGDVYVALAFGAEGFRRTFVVKRLRAELAQEKTVVSQFIDEARMGSLLVHSNIIPVFDFGKVGEEYFLASEYILGRDLEKLAKRYQEKEGKPLPADLVVYAVHEVLKALAFAHAKTDELGQPLGLVHRDISPQNVMISARGEIKLFDFGIVKAEGRETKTQAGVVKGNISFMSPEQAQGKIVDLRADLFSMGLLVYRLLKGDLLYHGETVYEMLVRAAQGPGEAELEQLRAMSSLLGPVLEKALQVDRNARFQSAAEFMAALPLPSVRAQNEMAALMERLFGDEMRAESTRLSNQSLSNMPAAVAPQPERA